MAPGSAPVRRGHPVRTEQIILFRCSNQIFAISSASVQEVRSVDSLAGAACEGNVNPAGGSTASRYVPAGATNVNVPSAGVVTGFGCE